MGKEEVSVRNISSHNKSTGSDVGSVILARISIKLVDADQVSYR